MARILIVEDDEIIYKMYQKLLQNHGYDVKIATDGEEGLKIALEEHPDLVLLDIIMPKMDGMTMLKQLRQDEWGKNVKVIILTNLDPSDNILQGVVADHPTYYMIKSNTKPEEILEHIKEVIKEQKKNTNIE